MNILIDIGHPGHVHLLRNLYYELKQNGHSISVTVKDIKIAKKLLEYYKITYIDLGKKKDSLLGKAFSQIKYNYQILKIVLKEKIELGVGSSATLAQISKITKMKSIIFDDDDDNVQPLFVKFGHPFCDTILSPTALIGHRKNSSSIFYEGYHELSYLHPKRFRPNIDVLKTLNIKANEIFFIMRFNVFKAHHDIGVNGLSIEQKIKLVKLLEPYGRIFVTSEREIEPELRKYQLHVSPEKIHSLLYYATMLLGDSQTMTSEAAVLGTPSVRCNDFVGRIAYLEEEEHRYGLTFGYKPIHFNELISKTTKLLQNKNLKKEWEKKRQRMLSDKIDVTAFQVWFIENYPDSIEIMKQNPAYQSSFK
jgi:uncharacterized protein